MEEILSTYGPVLWLSIFALVLLPLLFVGRVPLTYNLRNLAVRWRVTALTALAFTLVVGLLIVMLAFVNGLNRLTAGSAQPGNVIVLSEGATDELWSSLPVDVAGDLLREPGILRDEQNRPLGSRELYVVAAQTVPPGQGHAEEWERFLQVRGVEDPDLSMAVHGLDMEPGGAYFSPAGVQSMGKGRPPAIQVLVGAGLARELGRDVGKPRLEAGDVFQIGSRDWVVVGVMKNSGSAFDSEVWAKAQKVGDHFQKQGMFTTVVARAAGRSGARALADHLKRDYKKTPLEAQTETEYYSKLAQANNQLLYAAYFVAIIMGAGGAFGVMNTMFAAISQRTKDIGVMRIIGFASWQILVSFLLETLAIAVLGGVVGCALGLLTNGWSASSIVGGDNGPGKSVMLRLVVDGNTLAIGLLFTLVMGLLGGLVPSVSAMRLRPLESLR
jgi:ABC-type lipoprotein release transport system permease subunit